MSRTFQIISLMVLSSMMAQCRVVNSSFNAGAYKEEASAADVPSHIKEEIPGKSGYYNMFFSSTKMLEVAEGKNAEVQLMVICDIRGNNIGKRGCIKGESGYQVLKGIPSPIPDKKLFWASQGVLLVNKIGYKIVPMIKNGENFEPVYRLPRKIYFKDKKTSTAGVTQWQTMITLMNQETTCAGTTCHGTSQAPLPKNGWNIYNRQEFDTRKPAVKARITSTDAATVMPKSGSNRTLSDQQKQTLLNYLN